MSTNVTADSKLTRLCHVIKRDDFDGYGFNLHAEKGKPGQYIGKVDDDSPAEVAGLKQGDRIIEVNGVNIGNETHKQVVQRIKAIACEVRLLVIDPLAVSVSPSNQILDDANATTTTTTTINNKLSNVSHENQLNSSNNNNNGLTNGLNGTGTGNGNGEMPAILNSTSTTADETSCTDTNNKINNNKSIDENDLPKSNLSAPVPPPPSTNSMSYSSHAANSVPTRTSPDKSTTTKPLPQSSASSGGLNLTMTAAELRAKLAAKKKYDPKNDTVDLRKKYEIVQKL